MKMQALALILAIGLLPLQEVLAASEEELLKQRLQPVIEQLPEKMKAILGPYSVEVKSLGSLPTDLCAKDIDLGKLGDHSSLLGKKKIFVSSQLLHSSFKCSQKSADQLFQEAFLYQLAFLYDQSSRHWDTAEDKNQIERCQSLYSESVSKNHTNISTTCKYYLKNDRRISSSPDYRHLADFQGTQISGKNKMIERLVNASETISSQAHFAVNFASFFTDPSYQCRKPSFEIFFEELTGAKPFAGSSCEKITHVYTTTGGWKIDIDPARVYQVHYLFASEGEELMSRWGHSMLRVVMCAPYRKTVGPECLTDVAFHLVLSYRANVDDVMVNYWDGLTGKYPSQLMLFALPEIIDEYTRGQWREMMSLPLKITKAQQDKLVSSVLEHYWSYSGEYKFLSNNCASETDQLLRAVLPKAHPYQDTRILSPLGVYKELRWNSVIDLSLLKDKKEAQRKSYYFPSHKDNLEKAFAKIRDHFPGYADLTSWAHQSTAEERNRVYQELESFEEIGSAYSVEKYVELVQGRELQTRITRISSEPAVQARMSDLVIKIVASAQARLPWMMASAGYGVPLKSEVPSDEEFTKRLEQAIYWNTEYRKLLHQIFPNIESEMIGIKTNLELLTNRRRL